MYFSNLIGENVESKRDGRVGSVSFICGLKESVTPNAHVVLDKESNTLVVRQGDVPVSEDLFMFGIVSEEGNSKVFGEKSKIELTYNVIKDTDENPLIVVLAKSIKFFAGVSTYIKYITLEEGYVLAMLVYGACEFTFADGTGVAMQRCNTSNIEDRTAIEYTGKTISELSDLEDPESGYKLNNDIVNAVIVNIVSNNGKTYSGVKYKTLKSHTKLFNSTRLIEARKKAVLKKEKEEQRKQEMLEARKKAEIEAKRKAMEKEREEKMEVDKQFGVVNGVNQGAVAFMNAVRGLK